MEFSLIDFLPGELFTYGLQSVLGMLLSVLVYNRSIMLELITPPKPH